MPVTNRSKAMLERRKFRIRKALSGTAERPRLRVSRTIKHIYAQLINDENGHVLAAASSASLKIDGGNLDAAKAVGAAIAEQAKQKSIDKVCFDRGGRLYHGRVKALADAAREAGLQF
jgi:large subunit ribosomal protein L18